MHFYLQNDESYAGHSFREVDGWLSWTVGFKGFCLALRANLSIGQHRSDVGWHAYEVKSTTKVHDIQLYDAALQYHVMEQSGLQVRDISVVHINSDYERHGEIELNKL